MKAKITQAIRTAVSELNKRSDLRSDPALDLVIERPKDAGFGDYSSNVAMMLAKKEGRPPFQLAELIAREIASQDLQKTFKKIIAAKPGFINFYLGDNVLLENLKEIVRKNEYFGKSDRGKRKKVLIEFVSANPTGPLHVGHGRWAVTGDAIASLLQAVGFRVDREFYVNDIGRQVDLLKESVIARSQGRNVPEGGYGGEYIIELANAFKGKLSDKDITKKLVETMLGEQKTVLQSIGVKFDKWFYESSLHKSNSVLSALNDLKIKGVTFEEGGALWFKSKELGDDKNRVLVRDDGAPTYFASDIAYHINKFKRGYDQLIDVWGTDHHGYVARLKAALKVLGYPAERLKIVIGQLVSLFRGGEPVRMSKRTGEMVTLKEVIDETGKDATRFFFLMLQADSHLDFDLELAKKHSNDNPVYYVQYAHARITSILNEAKKSGYTEADFIKKADLSLINKPEELELIKKLMIYPDELAESAAALLPHRLINYLRDLSAIFHNFYHKYRVISEDRPATLSRLYLVFATRIVIKNVLKLLNISAPEQM